jgi:hypothetical protein
MPDERELIEYEVPHILGEIFPGRRDAPPHMRKCSACGTDSQPWPADQLTVIKHRHASQPLGHLRLYCPQHATDASEWSGTDASGGSSRPGAVCPNCFITVPSGTGECESCGTVITP